ncbi:MAG: PfkB family carbohydrate kinase [Treponema sp.]|nr:PfkB family carbohydrate kinase [Treponema sp.]
MKTILTVALNPGFQKILIFNNFIADTVNRACEHRLDAAGKGVNVSRVLTQLGKDCIHLTQLGGSMRPLFLQLCALDNLKIEWVESGSPIRFCYTVIDKAKKTVTELVEEGEKVEEHTGSRLEQSFDRLMAQKEPEISMLVISGSRAAGFDDSIISAMVQKAKQKAIPVILDIRGRDLLSCLQFEPDFIKPNLYEFALTFAPDLVRGNEIICANEPQTEASVKKRIFEICGELYKKYRTKTVLTRGKNPIWFFEGNEPSEFEVESVEPLNSIGCGDAFTAGLAGALSSGASLETAVAEGARCGKLNALLIRPGVIR